MASVRRSLILVLALVASLIPLVAAPAVAATPVFINEIHYDNVSTDAGEAIEIAGPAGTDLSTYSLVLYNGNGGGSYSTNTLDGTLVDDGSGFGFASLAISGIQNGDPDGIALVNGGTVVQFLSYEGTFAAVDGPAIGMTSTDIGVSESSTTPEGASLQLGGSGTTYEDFAWQTEQADTFGSVNTGQSFDGPPPPPPPPPTSDMVVSGVVDGPLSGGVPKAVEVTVLNDIADLSDYGIGVANNGGGSDGEEFSFPADAAAAGDVIYVATDIDGFESFFGCPPDYTHGSAVAVNGDDAIELFKDGTVVDVFGDINVDGNGEDWEYLDGWAKRVASTGPDGSTFVLANWTFSGPNALDGEATNDAAANAYAYEGTCEPTPTPSDLVINEVLASTAGTDPEYVELFGTPERSLEGLSFIVVESDDQTSNGTIDFRYDFEEGAALGDNGYLLLGASLVDSTYGVTPNIEIADNSLENSSSTYALVETSSLSGGTVTGAEVVVDAVGSTDGETADFFHLGAPVVGPDGTFFPAGVGRLVDGVDTDTVDDWTILSFSNDPGVNTPTAGTGIEPPPPPAFEAKIHEVQGAGGDSPLVGQRVIVEGVVVGDEETFERLRGFFVQEEDVDVDGDPVTSEGVFVYTHDTDTVNLGDVVRVEGTVEEYFSNTQLSDFAVVEIITDPDELALKDRTATPALVEFPLTSIDDLERYEGMAAVFPQELVVTEYFDYDRYGEVVFGLPSPGFDRPMQPTAVYPPGTPEMLALAEFNALSRITVDDGISAQNPDEVIHPVFRNDFTLTNYFRGGDTVEGLTGAVYFSFGEHKLYPNAYGEYTATTRPTAAPNPRGRLDVATLNTLNYFLTLDEDGVLCGPLQTSAEDHGCRGAQTVEEFERQRSKLIAALLELDADVVGLVELENTPGVEVLKDIVEGLNAKVGWKKYAYVDSGVVGMDVIKVGVIYQRWKVVPIGQAVLDTPEFLDPNNLGEDKNRAALAVSFRERWTWQKFSVVVNHLKSKGSGCGAGDDDPYAGSCDLTRTLAAEELADWIATNPTGVSDKDWLILGDLNSYDKENPVVALKDAGFTDLVDKYEGEGAYSYVFSGQWGHLDYAMSSKSLTRQVKGAAVWHLNSDEADIFDYDMQYKSNTQDALFEYDTAYRSSDHDAVIVGLNLRERIRRGHWWC